MDHGTYKAHSWINPGLLCGIPLGQASVKENKYIVSKAEEEIHKRMSWKELKKLKDEATKDPAQSKWYLSQKKQ